MKIAVNTRFLLKNRLEGIGWFTCETLKRITRQHREHEFVFFFDRRFDEEFVFSDNIQPVVLHPQARHPVLWYWWFEHAMPHALKKHQPDLFISTDGFLSLKTQVPTHLTIHDIAFEHFPEHVSNPVRSYYKWFTPRYAKKAERIVTVSDFTRNDLVGKYGINSEKIDVVYNGSNENYRPLSKVKKEEIKRELTGGADYFIFTGAIQPRKNISNIFQAFDLFKKKTGSPTKLLIAGRKAWQFTEILQVFERMTYKNEVIFIGHQPAERLAEITGSALTMVYPSLFEGFGIPLVEAMYAEIPVITSTVSSLPEVAGEAALLVDPNDVNAISTAMKQLAEKDELRGALVEKGKMQRQRFSWDLTAERFWASVERCVSSTGLRKKAVSKKPSLG